jgi:hypothetical protein
MYNINPTWGDLKSALEKIDNLVNMMIQQHSNKQLELIAKTMICIRSLFGAHDSLLKRSIRGLHIFPSHSG